MSTTLPQCSHTRPQRASRLTRKRGVYYYRRRLPKPSRGEIAIPLLTKNYRQAEYLAARLDHIFTHLLATMPHDKIRAALKEYLDACLEADREQRLGTPSWRSVYTGIAADLDTDPVDVDLEIIDDQLGNARERLARRELAAVSDTVDEIMQKWSIPAEDRKRLALGVLQAQVRVLETIRDRVLGGDVDLLPEPSDALPVPSQPVPEPLPTGPTLSEAAQSYVEFSVKHRGWRGQTLAQNKKTFAMFVERCGDRPVKTYTRTDTKLFYDMLQELPALYGKDTRWRGLPLKEVIQQSKTMDVPRLTMKTIKRHFSALGGLFGYLKKRGEYEGENPAYGFEFPLKGRNKPKRNRKYWHGPALVALFTSPVWTGSHEYYRSKPGKKIIRDEKFWLPLLGLFHGNRLEEFAQLRREDVRRLDGIWFFNITDEGERQVKNAQSIRRVPIHPTILKMGFIAYVEETAPNGPDLVFPELKPGGSDQKLGFYFTKWWTSYRRKIGVYERGLDYHSFRHGVTTKLFTAGVDRALVDELTGHEGEGTSQTVYKHASPLATLLATISKVEWPELDLTHLYVRT